MLQRGPLARELDFGVGGEGGGWGDEFKHDSSPSGVAICGCCEGRFSRPPGPRRPFGQEGRWSRS
ncbi:hypothetical protein ACFPRL_34350 [Pseudoclavibacter helvolus]